MNDQSQPPHQLSPQTHLLRAQGFMELEMLEEVEVELRAVSDELPWSKQKRMLLTFLYQKQKDWPKMQAIAKSLRHDFPTEEEWWVSEAYAARRADSIKVARSLLLEGLALNYGSAVIRYNLACYASLLGSPGEAMDFLKEAVHREEKYKALALQDEDLERMHQALIEMGWGENPI